MIQNIFITISAFIGMEFIAWAAHKYVMHGFLWYLHEDHHVLTGKPLQKNDSFALIFAIPSALGFIFGSIYNNNILHSVNTVKKFVSCDTLKYKIGSKMTKKLI